LAFVVVVAIVVAFCRCFLVVILRRRRRTCCSCSSGHCRRLALNSFILSKAVHSLGELGIQSTRAVVPPSPHSSPANSHQSPCKKPFRTTKNPFRRRQHPISPTTRITEAYSLEEVLIKNTVSTPKGEAKDFIAFILACFYFLRFQPKNRMSSP